MKLEPLWELRLVTPRLVLRLPNDDELDKLFVAAEAGIHPPDEMPFGVAWTDDLQHDQFVGFHREAWAAWTPAKWSCRPRHVSPRRADRHAGNRR